MGKMPLIVLSLSLLCFTVNANSQGCVEETLDCNKAVPTVFKLSDASCPCDDASHSGVLKFSDNEVHVCAGTEWNMVHLIKEVSGPYGSEGNPGQSCDDIYDELVKGSTPEDGIYWLRFPLPGNACIHYFDQELLLLADKINQYNNFSMQFFSLNIQFFNRSFWGLNKGVLNIFFVTILIESLNNILLIHYSKRRSVSSLL